MIVIKAQQYRRQEQNREAALERLGRLIKKETVRPKTRHPTHPTRLARKKRMDAKTRRGRLKALRARVSP